ncbi:uncharacterized protein TNCV_2861031 [Trichonephila clavipes]|nr:uncharacterized protein TNCV_2861031 [Trichonephila clavipes]
MFLHPPHPPLPGLALAFKCDRCSQTTLSRLASGHIKGIPFSGNKKISICVRCQDHQASEHITRCKDLARKDIYAYPLLVLNFLSQRFNISLTLED